ncbi:competence/damage-inducible protein A [Halobaculum gomorrense]|uniref:Molybdenum cofactor synthesis domain-containing protein n=1 Tax=Halobaculum gomorrense TaxID=43928 RepID=A0A1M5NQU5_9EURY|nr:molybdopterin-binding protein [Halobaculum gomorrense]SHG91974.1 molybdenum cofactor synthesis domain-containing protein [Halobaculum gomorrense]
MDVAIVTVGDEVLAGETTNTNASWLAGEIAGSGARVRRILTMPDDRPAITARIRAWSDAYDAVVVTGGLGGTHDDVTADALADAFDRELAVREDVRSAVVETVAAYRDANPEVVEEHDLEIDVAAWASLPEGARYVPNDAGLCPGFVLENVYAMPGVPDEVEAVFGRVADEFAGDEVARTLYTPQPEGSMVETLGDARDRFDVAIGSYPETAGHNRLTVRGDDPEATDEAVEWLAERVETVDE